MPPPPDQTGSPTPLARVGRVLRILVGLGLLAWVLGRADWRELAALLQQVHLGWLALFALATPVTVALSVWKWQVLLHAAGHRVRFATLFGLYVLSQFYNNLLPSSVGGDAVRVVMLGRRIDSSRDALSSVIVERFLGLSVLIILGLAAVVAAAPLRQHTALMTLTAAGLAFYGAGVVAVFDPRALRLAGWCFGGVRASRKPIEKLQQLQRSLWNYRRHRGALAKSVLLSLAFHVGAMANVYLACRALGQPVSWWAVAAITPVALVVTLLPISFNGVGVREWVFMVGFQLLGISPTLGIAASLLVRFKQLLWSCAGLLVHLGLPSHDIVSPRKKPSTTATNGSTQAG